MNTKEKLEKKIGELSKIGADPSGGVTRLLYSKEWIMAQNHLKGWMEDIGMVTSFDGAGNLFGTMKGSDKNPKIILTGSHIDTVTNGGNLDGQLGIIVSYLAIKELIEEYGQPKKTLELVSFAEEEGSRFPEAFWGSKNVVGIADKQKVTQTTDIDGVIFEDAMLASGFSFDSLTVKKKENVEAFIEMHIEQGSILEQEKKQLGIVQAIVGQKRFDVKIDGQANHAGTTPMSYRKDAAYAYAKIVSQAIDLAYKEGDPLVLTFGQVTLTPNTVNVVPGCAEFTMDVRHTNQEALNKFCCKLEQLIQAITKELEMHAEIELWMDEPPVQMAPKLVQTLDKLFEEKKFNYKLMHSGAGHDSQIMAQHYPTVMFFVPSIDGISHNPKEATKIEDIVVGVEAMKAILYKLAY